MNIYTLKTEEEYPRDILLNEQIINRIKTHRRFYLRIRNSLDNWYSDDVILKMIYTGVHFDLSYLEQNEIGMVVRESDKDPRTFVRPEFFIIEFTLDDYYHYMKLHYDRYEETTRGTLREEKIECCCCLLEDEEESQSLRVLCCNRNMHKECYELYKKKDICPYCRQGLKLEGETTRKLISLSQLNKPAQRPYKIIKLEHPFEIDNPDIGDNEEFKNLSIRKKTYVHRVAQDCLRFGNTVKFFHLILDGSLDDLHLRFRVELHD